MFTFRKGLSGKKATNSPASLDASTTGADTTEPAGPSEPLSTPSEPPTPSPYRSEPSSLPLVVENAPTPVITGKEVASKGEVGSVKKMGALEGGGTAAVPVPVGATTPGGGPVVTVGKSARAPTLRLKEGSRVVMKGLKAKALGDIGSKFFTFGAKKEPDLFVRFSMGSLVPPCRTMAVAKVKQGCDWGEEGVEFIITEEITHLVGPDLKLTVQLYSAGQKGNDTLVGSAVVDMSEHLNQGSFTVALTEGNKKGKGELEMIMAYLLPGLLATETPADEAVVVNATGGDQSMPPPEVGSSAAHMKPDTKDTPLLSPAAIMEKSETPVLPGGAPTPTASVPASPVEGGKVGGEQQSVVTPPTKRKSVTISLPHEVADKPGPSPSQQQGGKTSPAPSPSALDASRMSLGAAAPVLSTQAQKEGSIKTLSPIADAAAARERRVSTDGKPTPSPHPVAPGDPDPAARRQSTDHPPVASTTVSTPVGQLPVSPAAAKGGNVPSPAIAPAAAAGGGGDGGGGGGGGAKAATPVSPAAAPSAASSAQAASATEERGQEAPSSGGLEVTQELAHALLIKVKEDAASSLQQQQEDPSAVRRMMDKVKQEVAKDMQPPQQQQQGGVGGAVPAVKTGLAAAATVGGPQTPPGSARRPSLKLDLVVAAAPVASSSPHVKPAIATVAAAAATPGSNSTSASVTGAKAPTPVAIIDAQAASGDKAVVAAVESEDNVLLGTAGPGSSKGILSLKEVMEGMQDEDDEDDEAFFLGIRPGQPAGGKGGVPKILDSDEAVTRLQAAWRRKVVGRQLRREQLHARRIQSLYRGHRDRKEFSSKVTFLKKLESEERKRQDRQKRLMINHRELALLRITPALELGQMDLRRKEFAARRIQHFVRKRCLASSARRRPPKPSLSVKSPRSRRPSIPALIDTAEEEEAVQDFVDTYKRSLLSPRSYAKNREGRSGTSPAASPPHPHQCKPPGVKRKLSAIRLADLHRQVMSSTKAKDRRDVLEKFESALAMGVRAVNSGSNPQSGAQVRYQRLLESRYEARLLLSARQDVDEEREETNTTRRERLGRVRQLLDQLEAPPTLGELREAFGLEAPPEGGEAKELKAVPDIALPWRLPRGGKAVRIAEEAHRHALETMQEKGSRWWVTALPEDLAEPPIDIRTVQAPPPFAENVDPQEALLAPGLGRFDEDEASLWWYAYSRKGVSVAKALQLLQPKDETGPGTGDVLFQRARLGRAVLREKNLEDMKLREGGEEGTANDLVCLILKERKKRLCAAALAREAELRRVDAKKKEDAAAVRIQSAYRGSAVRKQFYPREQQITRR